MHLEGRALFKVSPSSTCQRPHAASITVPPKIYQDFNSINPYLPSGLFHPYILDESIWHFKGLLFHFYSFVLAKSENSDQTPRYLKCSQIYIYNDSRDFNIIPGRYKKNALFYC